MNILITGAGGFIGSHLAEFMLSIGHEVDALDLAFPYRPDLESRDGVRFWVGDFRDERAIRSALVGTDVLFHLASAHLNVSSSTKEYWEINVSSLVPLLERAREAGVRRFVHVSTAGVYGDIRNGLADERTPCHPQNLYGLTKLKGEQVVTRFSQKTGLPVTIIRPSWVYGPRCPRTIRLLRSIERGWFVMFGKGTNLRHPVYVSDFIEGLYLSAVNPEAEGVTFIIAGEQPVTVEMLVEEVCRLLGRRKPRLALPTAIGRSAALIVENGSKLMKKRPPFSRRSLEFFVTNNAFDISKSRRLLGFEPRVPLSEGLARTYRWMKEGISVTYDEDDGHGVKQRKTIC